MPVAPRIINDVSYVTDIIHMIHFAWQAQYLVRLEGSWSVTFCCRRSIWCSWSVTFCGRRSIR